MRRFLADAHWRTALILSVVVMVGSVFYWTAAFDVAEMHVRQDDFGDWIHAGWHFVPWPMDYWDRSGLIQAVLSHALTPDNPDAWVLSYIRSGYYVPLTALIVVAFGEIGFFVGALPSTLRRPRSLATACGVVGVAEALIAIAILSIAFLRFAWWESQQVTWAALVVAGLLGPVGMCLYLLQHPVSVRRLRALLPAIMMGFVLFAYVVALLSGRFISTDKTLGVLVLAPIPAQVGLFGWAVESRRLQALLVATPLGVATAIWAMMTLVTSDARWGIGVTLAEWFVPGSAFKYVPFTPFAPAFVVFLVAAVVNLALAYWMRRSARAEARRPVAAA